MRVLSYKPLWIAALLLLSVATTGCTTKRVSFPGKDGRQVWTALLAVAQSPDYNDPDPSQRWFVKENQVWVDNELAIIEIYRELDRIRYPARMKPVRQRRTWRFQILFDDLDTPEAMFISRGAGIPMQAAAEGRRYFDDVWELLDSGQLPEPAPVAPPVAPLVVPPVPAPDPMDVEPAIPDEPGDLMPVDVDLLDPDGR